MYAFRAQRVNGDSRSSPAPRKPKNASTGIKVKLTARAPTSALTTVLAMGEKMRPSTRCIEKIGM